MPAVNPLNLRPNPPEPGSGGPKIWGESPVGFGVAQLFQREPVS